MVLIFKYNPYYFWGEMMNKIIKASLMAISLSTILVVGHYSMISERERNLIKKDFKNIIGYDDEICN